MAREPSNPSDGQRIDRRTLVATVLPALATAGCSGIPGFRSDSPTTTDGSTPAGNGTTRHSQSPYSTQSATVTATEEPSTRTWTSVSSPTPGDTPTPSPTPAFNATEYPTATAFGPDDNRIKGRVYGTVLGDDALAVRLLVDHGDWRAVRREIESSVDASYEGFAFTSETDFSSGNVVVAQLPLSSGGNRLRLASVSGVGTATVRLRIFEVNVGVTQDAPVRLLFVRLPNEGTEPQKAVVEYGKGESAETVRTETK